MLAANQNHNLSQCSPYKINAFALVEVTGYSMHTDVSLSASPLSSS